MGNDPERAPLLSFVVPVYRVEAYLRQCIDSLLFAEDSAAMEVIAVNDGSTDSCGWILDEYARRDARLRAVHLPTNVGLGQARNAGIDHATGEYVWFVDGDDWLPPGSIEAVRDRLVATRPDVLIIDHAEVFDGGRMVARSSADVHAGVAAPVALIERPELLRLAQSACTKIVRRALVDEAKLRFLPGWYEDTSFSHPLLMAAGRIDLLQRVCYHYRRRGQGGITTSVSPRHFEVFDQYERLFDVVDQAEGAYDVFRPELFRLMINHYLVIVGNDWRLPRGMQREFFNRVAEDYRRWLPAEGYPVPGGVTGLKHRLVRRNAYPAYAALRLGHRALVRALRLLGLDHTEQALRAAPTVAVPAAVTATGTAATVRGAAAAAASVTAAGAAPMSRATTAHVPAPSIPRQGSGPDPIGSDRDLGEALQR